MFLPLSSLQPVIPLLLFTFLTALLFPSSQLQGGAKVAVLDKEKFPRDKYCGDAVCTPAIHILRDMGVMQQVGGTVGCGGKKQADSRGEPSSQASHGSGVRPNFDRAGPAPEPDRAPRRAPSRAAPPSLR